MPLSKSNINRSLKHEGKRRQARINGQVFKVDQQSRKLSLKVLATIKRKFAVENPPTFEKVAGSMRLAPSKSFPPKFVIVGSMCCDKVFPLFRVPFLVTVDAKYFVDYVLHPLIHDFLIPHYKEDINKVIIHFDKATSHTAKLSSSYLERMKREYGISFLKKEDIPVKGADIVVMDFFAFGYLKQQLKVTRARTEAGVWKRTREIWSQITPKTCVLVFESWKRRLLAVRHNSGGHVEQTKNIHRTNIKL